MTSVYVTVRDRVTCLRRVVARLEKLADVSEIVLIDNASTWPPLLVYLAASQHEVIRLGENLGHLALWKAGLAPQTRFVLTDPDVLPDCPDDALGVLAAVLDHHPELTKVGLGLRLDDLPPEANNVREWEKQFWVTELEPGLFSAAVDTTFALYRAGAGTDAVPAARTAAPYLARHLPWYEKGDSAEDVYYREHALAGVNHW